MVQRLLFRVLGASACVQLKRYKDAMNWCEKGFAVSFHNISLQGYTEQVMLPL